eukprot:403351912
MSQIQIGSRVQINSFKYKGQEGIVKFFGEVEDKIGLWVGVELDLPKGDMDGTVNGIFLFECQGGHGLLLRSTQVKTIEAQSNVPSLNIGINNNLSDSPLLTPKDPPNNTMGQMAGVMRGVMSKQVSQADDQPSEGGDNKTSSWKDRLEKLRKQKELKKLQDEEIKAHSTHTGEEEKKKEQEELKKVFEPAQGITRDKDGKIAVKQDQTTTSSTRPSMRPQSKDPNQRDRSKDPYNSNPRNKSRSASRDNSASKDVKKNTLAQRVGSGLKGPTGLQSRLQGPKTGTTSTAQPKTQTSAAEAAREKLMKKNEEVKAKLESRQSEVKTTGGATSRLGMTQKTTGTAAVVDKTKNDSASTKTDTKTALGQGVKKLIGKDASTTGDSTGTAASKTLGGRPMTARQTKQEEFKADPAKTTTTATRQSNVKANSSRERSQMRNKLGGLTKTTTEEAAALKKSIIEEDEEKKTQASGRNSTLPAQRSLMQKPSSSNLLIKQQSTTSSTDVSQLAEANQQMFSGVSQQELKKQEAELRKKKEEAFALQIEVKELSEKIAEIQQENKDKIEEIKTEYEIKILELESKLNDNQLLQNVETMHQAEKEKLQQQFEAQQNQLKQDIENLKNERDQALSKVTDQAKLIKHAEEEKARLQEDVEAKQIEIETIMLEIDALKDEKEELLNQLRASSEIQGDSSSLSGLTEDELKSQNTKLRQAISALTMGFEVEKSKYNSKISDLDKRARLVEEYEKKLEDMDLLIEEIEIKDSEIKAMEEKLDEQSDFEKMVEEMAEEILKKEEDIETLQARITELEEMNAVQEELNESQDQYVKELNEEIANKDAQIFNFEQNVTQLEEMVLEQDQKIQKYKEKCNELNQKSTMLQDELSSAYSAGDQKVKISTLIEKQNQLITKLREAGKKDLDIMVQKIEFWQEKLKMKVIEGFIPKRLSEETRLDSLEKIQLLNKTKNKALLLTREICEKQIQQSDSLFEDKMQLKSYQKLLISISENCVKFIDSCHKIMYVVQKLSIDKYQDLTKLIAWNKFELINIFLEKVMELLKEESLSFKFDISQFVNAIKGVQDLQSTCESRYIEKTQEEIAEEKAEGFSSANLSIAQQERQKDLKFIPKLLLRNECLKMSLAVIALSIFSQSSRQEDTVSKCKLIYWRLLEIVFKLDGIDPHDNGNDFVSLLELGTDSRLEQKYQAIKLLWETEPQSELEPQERDWSSVLEAIERDITHLNNDFKFKKLLSKVEEEYKESQIQIDDIYSKGWDAKGPWSLIVDKIRQDLEDTGLMKEKIEQLQNKVKDQSMHFLMLKREKDDLTVVNQSLEQRLGDAQSKAEKVPALEMEKKRLIEKEAYYNQQMELAKKEIDILREKEKDLQSKVTDMETNPLMSRDSMRASVKKTALPSTTNAQARQSRTSQYFQKLAQAQLIGHKRDSVTPLSRQTTSVTSNELQKQLQISEEAFYNVIIELQKDRMMLKGQHLLERLHKLEKTDGPMNEYIKMQREKKEVAGKLSRDEQNKLESALDNVMYLKKKMKKEMALIKVIDITKRDEEQKEVEKKLLKEIVPEGKEKINYEIMKAKEQVNDAFKVLFAKDSKLHQIQTLSKSQHLAQQESNIDQLPKSNTLRMGFLKLSGAPLKQVISLVPSDVQDFKSHIGIFNQQ